MRARGSGGTTNSSNGSNSHADGVGLICKHPHPSTAKPMTDDSAKKEKGVNGMVRLKSHLTVLMSFLKQGRTDNPSLTGVLLSTILVLLLVLAVVHWSTDGNLVSVLSDSGEAYQKRFMENPAVQASMEVRRQCLTKIRSHHERILQPLLSREDRAHPLFDWKSEAILLVDPSYSYDDEYSDGKDVGDQISTRAEQDYLIHQLGWNNSILECRYSVAPTAKMSLQSITKKEARDRLGIGRRVQYCNDVNLAQAAESSTTAVWHAGADTFWGDGFRSTQKARISSIQDLLRNGFMVVGLPQTMHYDENDDRSYLYQDILELRTVVKNGLNLNESYTKSSKNMIQEKLILTWRDQESFVKAKEMFDFCSHALVPDLAFQLFAFDDSSGVSQPIRPKSLNHQEMKQWKEEEQKLLALVTANNAEGQSDNVKMDLDYNLRQEESSKKLKPTPATHMVDILLVLRDDFDSTQRTERNDNKVVRKLLQKGGGRWLKFKVVDWDDRFHLFPYWKKQSTNTTNREEDTEARKQRQINQLVSMGKVIVTDRLSVAIVAYHLGLPLVIVDSKSRQVTRTFGTAFHSWSGCQDSRKGLWRSTNNLENALQQAVRLLKENELR